jgi:hypothetical protein
MANQYSPSEISAIIDEYHKALEKNIPISRDLAKRMADASKGQKEYTDTLKASFNNLGSSIMELTDKFIEGEEGLSVYNNLTKSLGDALGDLLGWIPIIGPALSGAAKAGADYVIATQKQGDALFKIYQDVSKNGLTLGMDDTFRDIQSAGYTLKEMSQFTELMKNNAQLLATYSGTAAQGAKEFVKISEAITSSGVRTEFLNMGMTVDDINNSTLNYIKFQKNSGSVKIKTLQEQTEGARDFIEQQDRLTKMTGLSAEAQNKAMEHALSTEQYAAHNAKLQRILVSGNEGAADAKKELDFNRTLISYTMSSTESEKIVDNLTKVLSGSINDPGFQSFSVAYPKAFMALRNGIKDANVIMNLMDEDAVRTSKDYEERARVGIANKAISDFPAIQKHAGRAIGDRIKLQDKVQKDQKLQQEGNVDQSTKNMTDITQAQRNATQSAEAFINIGIGPVLKAFGATTDVAEQIVGLPAELLGKQGQEGGGTTLLDKTKSAVGATPSSYTAPKSAVGATPSSYTAPKSNLGFSTSTAPLITPSTSPVNMNKYLKATALIESGGNTNAKAGTSSAGGLYQFLDSTWQETVKAMGKHYTLQDKYDPAKAIEVMTYFTNQQKSQLEKSTGTPATSTDLYMAHFLGAGGAGQFINAMSRDPNASAVATFPKQAAANHAIFYDGQRERSLTEVYKLMGSKVANAEEAVSTNKWGGKDLPSSVATIKTGEIPKGASGNILSGPTSGFMALLHGVEAVVPLRDGKTIQVESNEEESTEVIEMLVMKVQKLDKIINSMQSYMRTSNKILQLQS